MREQWIALLFGWIVVFSFLILASFGLTVALIFSEINTNVFSWLSFSLGTGGLFIGGIVAGGKAKNKGWIFGGIVGTGFTLFVFLIQYLGYQNGFSLEQAFQHVAYIGAATIGGMLGVNMFQGKNKKS